MSRRTWSRTSSRAVVFPNMPVVVAGGDYGELLKEKPTEIDPVHFLSRYIVKREAVEISYQRSSVQS